MIRELLRCAHCRKVILGRRRKYCSWACYAKDSEWGKQKSRKALREAIKRDQAARDSRKGTT